MRFAGASTCSRRPGKSLGLSEQAKGLSAIPFSIREMPFGFPEILKGLFLILFRFCGMPFRFFLIEKSISEIPFSIF
jgi:hypothetical protein